MENHRPKYLEVYETIRQSILSGAYKPEEKLPSEAQLIKTCGFSRQTVRKALEQLAKDGFITTRQGMGSVVSTRRRFGSGAHTKHVLLLVHYPEHYYFPNYIRGIDRVLQKNDYSLTIKFSHNRIADEAAHLSDALKHDYAGILLFPAQSAYLRDNLYLYRYLEESRMPCVLLSNPILDTRLPVVTVDDYQGGYLAGQHLLSLGHKKIACFVNSDEHSARMRYSGLIASMNAGGVRYDDGATVWYRYNTREDIFGAENRSALAEKLDKCTACFCYNDEMALRVFRFMEALGKEVPRDFSIVGYDDSYPATLTKIGLTTIRQNPEEIGQAAANNLLALLDKRDFDANRTFTPELVVRESTAAPYRR